MANKSIGKVRKTHPMVRLIRKTCRYINKYDQLIWHIKTISVGHFLLAFEQRTPTTFINQYQFIVPKILRQYRFYTTR